MKKLLLLALLLFGWSCNSQLYAQTKTVIHDVDFESGTQNMWGPSFDPFTINMEEEMFGFGVSENFSLGSIGGPNGLRFGARFSGFFDIGARMVFSISDFTTGDVSVDYPIRVDLDMPADNSYDQGDTVTIESDYTVRSGWKLETNYPDAGKASLDFFFRFGMGLQAEVCFFGCATLPIIPAITPSEHRINIFEVSTDGLEMFSVDGGEPAFSYGGLPITVDDLPNGPKTKLQKYGVSGSLGLPDVVTDDELYGHDLEACGESTYFNIEDDVFKLISELKIPYVSAFFKAMSGSYSIMGFSVNWTIFSMSLGFKIVNNQCFDFEPTVHGKYEFPTPVHYAVYDGGGSVKEKGRKAIININIGDKIEFKYPCYFEDMEIKPTYSITGKFTNHTYDEAKPYFKASALEFGISLPSYSISIDVGFFSIDITIFPGFSRSWGPLWEIEKDITAFSYDWYKNTWNLEGFDKHNKDPFHMTPNRLYLTHNQVDVSCFGGSNGEVALTHHAVSPALPYSYDWTNGGTAKDMTNLTAGSYQVEVKDNNGCQLYTGVVINEPSKPLTIEYTKSDKLCGGGADDGTIITNVSGGTPGYTYDWSNGGTTSSISSLQQGSYSLTVEDAQGCVENISVDITVPEPLDVTTVISDVNCNSGSDGSITTRVTGGELPYVYSWSNGDKSDVISGLTAGSYTLTLTDGNGCVYINTYIVNEPALPLNVTSSITDVLCHGESTGSIVLSVSDGTPGYKYRWTNGKGIYLPEYGNSITNRKAGKYTAIVTDMNGCTFKLPNIITEPTAPLSSTPTITNVNCYGDATGIVVPTIQGGTPNYTYDWSNGSTNDTLLNVVSGTYQLQLTDANGCVATYNYTISQPKAPIDIAITKRDVLCYGGNTGWIHPRISGGTPTYTYQWSNAKLTKNIDSLVIGTYQLVVTDDLGCRDSSTVVINQPDSLKIIPTITDVACYGDNSGSIALAVSGGVKPYQQIWSDKITAIFTNTTSSISNVPYGNYHYRITDKNGCRKDKIYLVNQPIGPLEIENIVIDDVNCYGMATGSVSIDVVGGTPTYSYNWSAGQTTQDATAIYAGNHTLTVTDSNNCILVQSFKVSQPNAPLVATVKYDSVNCYNESNGRVYSTVTGGTYPYTYLWSNNETTEDIDKVPAGTYTLTVTDKLGCNAYTGTTVMEPDSLLVNPIIVDASCYGGSDGTVTLNIQGGIQPYYYNWGNKKEILLNHLSETITRLNEGEYFIRVKDRNDCVNEQYIYVGQPDSIHVDYTIGDALCFEDSSGYANLTITGGVQPYSTQWSDGQTTKNAVNLPSDNYIFTVTDDHQCRYVDTIFVDQPDELKSAHQIEGVSCEDQTDGKIYIQPYGGVSPYWYDWSNSEVTPNIENLPPGEYILTLTDAHNCIQTFHYIVPESSYKCVEVPNTFTPNGDNYNDVWRIKNLDLYPNAVTKVFNKWGTLIFESDNYNDYWDGTFNERPLPAAVYFYVIELNNSDGYQYTGTITIIR